MEILTLVLTSAAAYLLVDKWVDYQKEQKKKEKEEEEKVHPIQLLDENGNPKE